MSALGEWDEGVPPLDSDTAPEDGWEELNIPSRLVLGQAWQTSDVTLLILWCPLNLSPIAWYLRTLRCLSGSRELCHLPIPPLTVPDPVSKVMLLIFEERFDGI